MEPVLTEHGDRVCGDAHAAEVGVVVPYMIKTLSHTKEARGNDMRRTMSARPQLELAVCDLEGLRE